MTPLNHKIISQKMSEVGYLTAIFLDELYDRMYIGVSTNTIDEWARDFAKKYNLALAPLFYQGYPKSICTSVNHVVCHGIPSDRKLKSGDTVNVDVTFVKDSWHGDSSRTYMFGNVNPLVKKLISATHQSMMAGIKAAGEFPSYTGDIGHAIENVAKQHNFTVVKEYCGHGIGQKFHTPPNILNFGEKGQGTQLKENMSFTIEPMLNAGEPNVKLLNDGWTVVTKDKKISAQFEHTVGITENGVEIFTQSPNHINPLHAIEK